MLMGELCHPDNVRGVELDIVVDLDPDILARVEEPFGSAATASADQGILADGSEISLAVASSKVGR